MPLFSVIIPIYKVENDLSECIDSLLTQTYTDFELILVDDGSPDSCGKICDAYAAQDNRIRVIHKENGGVTSARLAGAEAAVGEYVACVDGDDWVSPDYLEQFAKPIEEGKPDIVCCGFVESHSDKSIDLPYCVPAGYYSKAQLRKIIFPMLIEREDGIQFTNNICGKAIRRELFLSQQIKVDKRIKVGEDMAVIKPCLYYADHVYIIKDCLYYYRQNPTSVMRSRTAFDMNDPMRIGNHFESQINMQDADFQLQVYRNVVHSLYDALVSQFYKKEEYRVIAKDIKRYLQEPYYQNALDKCKFHGSWKMHLKHFVLKHRITLFMWLHNRVWCYQRNAHAPNNQKSKQKQRI